MKTIYVKEKQWENRTLGGELGWAVGDTGRAAGICRQDEGRAAGEDKVIDLAAWKAENLVEPDEPENIEPESGLAQYEGRELVRHRRRKHVERQARVELAATLAVVGVMAALILRILLF